MARAFWRWFFPFLYGFLRLTDPFWRRLTEHRGLGNTVELLVVGRRTGRERGVMVGLLVVGGRRYLGHANRSAAWLRNLVDAGEGRLIVDGAAPIQVRAARIEPGAEQDAVVHAASRQHPFPVDVAYRLARASIRVDGVFVRLETADASPVPLPASARRD
ncbi:MAG TPA: hypothetical protein VMT36_01310 [Candidatus Saccharimonadia bacterium]|nr:hypothetical protein [Candidatus Saccharimonadia bacterium]